jgi:hypothetical protein
MGEGKSMICHANHDQCMRILNASPWPLRLLDAAAQALLSPPEYRQRPLSQAKSLLRHPPDSVKIRGLSPQNPFQVFP